MKKLLAAILTFAMVVSCLCIPAFARDIYGTVEVEQSAAEQGLSMDAQLDRGAPDWYAEEKAAIKSFVVDTQSPVIEYFDEEVQSAVQEIVPCDVRDLEPVDFASLTVEGFDAENAETVKVTANFKSDFEQSENAATVIGIQGDEGIEWTALKTTVVDGKYVIEFTSEALEAVSAGGAISVVMAAAGEGEDTLPQTGNPSITVGGMYAADPTGEGEEDAAEFAIVVNQTVDEWFTAESEKMGAAESVVSCFPEDVQTMIGEKLTEGTDASNLVAYEAVTLETEAYKIAMGDKTVAMSFPTSYSADQNVVAVLGFYEGENVKWYVLDTSAADGSLEIQFPIDQLQRMGYEEGMLVVVSDPIQ